MAFPVVEATNTSSMNTSATSHTVALPASIATGDVLVALIVTDGSYVPATPTGWSKAFHKFPANYAFTVSAFYRTADGGEGATQTFTTTGGCDSAHCTYRISGGSGNVEAATAVEASGVDNPNPPSLTPSWGAKDTLWLAVAGAEITQTFTGAPSNYSTLLTANGGTGAPYRRAASAHRQLNATSEDPGTFTTSLNVYTGWIANTLAVEPETASAVSVTVPAGTAAITGYAPTVTGAGLEAPSVIAVTLDGTTATLEWVNASSNGVRVWYKHISEESWTAPVAELTGGETTYDIEWLVAGERYDFGVSHFTATEESDIAYTTTAVGAPVSVDVPAGSVTITGYAPTVYSGGLLAPTGLTATPDNDGFDLAWTDTNGGAVGYRVEYRRTAAGGDYTLATITADGAESYDLEWLAQGIEYDIRVRPSVEPDTGTASATATATTGTVAVVSGVFG